MTDQVRAWTVKLPAGMALITANQRLHWAQRARLTRTIRHTRCLLARSARIPRLERAHVIAEYWPKDHRRRDPANWYPSVKAATDGIVDAGVLADDDARHLVGPDMRLGDVVAHSQLVLHIYDLSELLP